MLLLRIIQFVFLLTVLKSHHLEAAELHKDEPAWIDLHQERKASTLDDARPGRLPNTTIPLRYDLHLMTQVHREIYEFSGNCSIEILVRQSTEELVLHAQHLKIKSVVVEDLTTNKPVDNLVFIPYEAKELLIVKREGSSSEAPIFVHDHRLRLTILYTGVISEGEGYQMLRDENGTVYGLATQFQPMYARITMPCYDEPSFKANFTLRLTHGSNFTAVSNMPQKSAEVDSERSMTTTTFVETPPISTFLLAFIITNYKYVKVLPETDKDIDQGVFIPPAFNEENIVDTLREFSDVLELFGNWMETPYVLPKMDQILVPPTSGVEMENWGIIAYSEEDRSRRNRRIAHQWFGNLVTPAWWSSMWLSESLANYFSYALTEMLQVYKVKRVSAIEHFELEFCMESLMIPADAPISAYSEAILEGMDNMNLDSVKRASCMMQMFYHAFGEDVFEKGVANYLKEHAYSVADENNFYDAMQSAAVMYYTNHSQSWDHNVPEIMKTWTHNRGIPTVTITRNYDDNTLRIRQSHATASNSSAALWWIPLNFATTSQPDFVNTEADYFMPPIAEVTIDLSTLNITLKNDDWYMVNKLGKGLYGVSYDAENMRRIVEALQKNYKTIHKQNRVYLLWNIVKLWIDHDDSVDLQTALEVVKYLGKEEDPFVRIASKTLMQMMITFIQDTAIYEMFKDFMHRTVVSKLYHEYNTIDANVVFDKLENFDDFACDAGLPECLLKHKNRVLNEMSGKKINETQEEEEEDGILCYAAMDFNDEEFDRAVQYYANQNRWKSLACTENPKQFEKLLQQAFDFSTDTDIDGKLQFVSDLPFLNRVGARNITWVFWDQHISSVSKTTKEQLKSFCDNLQYNMKFVFVRQNEKASEAAEICKRGINYEFDETKKYKNSLENFAIMKHWFVDHLINEDVRKWLEKEIDILNKTN